MVSNNTKAKLKEVYFKLYYPTFFRLVVWIKRKLSKRFQFNRPTSYPHITGDGFRSLSQHVMDDASEIVPEQVLEGDVIFVRSDMLHTFFKKINPRIKNRYILLSHNADNNINQQYSEYEKENIIHWFAQNLIYKDSKISPLPIGLENLRYTKEIQLLKQVMSENLNKKNKIVLSFRLNPERVAIKNKLIGLKTVEDVPNMNKLDYYKKIAEYKFVASPEGNGIDCHRTWEALLLKSVPILIRSVTTEFFESIGLPVLLIDNWDEVSGMDEGFLESKYKELRSRFSSPALYMQYWIDRINNLKK